MTVSVIVPTLNGGRQLVRLLDALANQTAPPHEIVVIDSMSTDGTREAAVDADAILLSIDRTEFRHGRARNAAAERATGDVLVFMTQDVLPDPTCLEQLARPIEQGLAGAAYARQVPRRGATELERFARSANYPSTSHLVAPNALERAGIRSFFLSNACAAVDRAAFSSVDGFPDDVIMNEDMNLAARLLRAGFCIAYRSEATVTHSHALSLSETFRRYFDIGVALEQSEPELRRAATSSSGSAFATTLLKHLAREGRPDLIPLALADLSSKWCGHFLGRRHRALPRSAVRLFSLHRAYWS